MRKGLPAVGPGSETVTRHRSPTPMTGRERIMATFAGQPVDRVPVHHLQFSGHAAHVILGRDALVGGGWLQWQELNSLWQADEPCESFDARCEADAVAIAQACGRDDVIRETMACLEAAHDLGGIVVGTSNMIMPGTPPENILAMLDTIAANRTC